MFQSTSISRVKSFEAKVETSLPPDDELRHATRSLQLSNRCASMAIQHSKEQRIWHKLRAPSYKQLGQIRWLSAFERIFAEVGCHMRVLCVSSDSASSGAFWKRGAPPYFRANPSSQLTPTTRSCRGSCQTSKARGKTFWQGLNCSSECWAPRRLASRAWAAHCKGSSPGRSSFAAVSHCRTSHCSCLAQYPSSEDCSDLQPGPAERSPARFRFRFSEASGRIEAGGAKQHRGLRSGRRDTELSLSSTYPCRVPHQTDDLSRKCGKDVKMCENVRSWHTAQQYHMQ